MDPRGKRTGHNPRNPNVEITPSEEEEIKLSGEKKIIAVAAPGEQPQYLSGTKWEVDTAHCLTVTDGTATVA
jgi:hypothetical protein